MVKAVKGTLVQCDASIKAVLLKIDSEHQGGFVLEDLDDETLIARDSRLEEFKALLQEELKNAIRDPVDSDSD